jgi:hypothetical protein
MIIRHKNAKASTPFKENLSSMSLIYRFTDIKEKDIFHRTFSEPTKGVYWGTRFSIAPNRRGYRPFSSWFLQIPQDGPTARLPDE